MGEVVLESFQYLRNEIHNQVDIYETLQRITIEVLGQVAFGYSFKVENFIRKFYQMKRLKKKKKILDEFFSLLRL